jgi:hypothetical protein
MNIQRLVSLFRWCLFGGSSGHEAKGGFAYLNTNNGWTTTNTNVGSRKGSIKILRKVSTSPLGERQQLGSILLGRKSHERNIEYCKGI